MAQIFSLHPGGAVAKEIGHHVFFKPIAPLIRRQFFSQIQRRQGLVIVIGQGYKIPETVAYPHPQHLIPDELAEGIQKRLPLHPRLGQIQDAHNPFLIGKGTAAGEPPFNHPAQTECLGIFRVPQIRFRHKANIMMVNFPLLGLQLPVEFRQLYFFIPQESGEKLKKKQRFCPGKPMNHQTPAQIPGKKEQQLTIRHRDGLVHLQYRQVQRGSLLLNLQKQGAAVQGITGQIEKSLPFPPGPELPAHPDLTDHFRRQTGGLLRIPSRFPVQRIGPAGPEQQGEAVVHQNDGISQILFAQCRQLFRGCPGNQPFLNPQFHPAVVLKNLLQFIELPEKIHSILRHPDQHIRIQICEHRRVWVSQYDQGNPRRAGGLFFSPFPGKDICRRRIPGSFPTVQSQFRQSHGFLV